MIQEGSWVVVERVARSPLVVGVLPNEPQPVVVTWPIAPRSVV